MAKQRPNRLRVLRADREFTQLTLARRARVNVTRVSFIENGLAAPKPEERERLARALGVTVADAFPGTEPEAGPGDSESEAVA